MKAKVKNKNIHFPIVVTNINPPFSVSTLIKVPFSKQISTFFFEEITSNKTRVTIHISIHSFLNPFFKWSYLNPLNKALSKYLAAHQELSNFRISEMNSAR